MSILSNIIGRIFGRAEASPASATAAPASGTVAAPAMASAAEATTATSAAAPAPPVMNAIDFEKVMAAKAVQAGQKLNWQTSIVDLMKLLEIDSSLESRKALATELSYAGDMGDSATMNVWLHKQVMKKVAENGGEVPASLRD